MTPPAATYPLLQGLVLIALLWPKGDYIPADWGAGIALALLYIAVMLAVMALWARGWRLRPVLSAPSEADGTWHRGPYRFVRYPMILALLLGALGWCLVYRSPPNIALFVALCVLAWLDTRRRDRQLTASGPEGVEHVAARAALIPGLY